MTTAEALSQAKAALTGPEPVVFLMCGIPGSGKTAFALQLEKEGCTHLSMDDEILSRFGRYGSDYPPRMYGPHQIAAEETLRERLLSLLEEKRHVVVDFSFWQRTRRYLYTSLIRQHGGTPQIVYLRVSPQDLHQRLVERSRRFDANAALPIANELVQQYVIGFEPPVDEECWTVEPGH
ncbi:MAG: ATP-binding protein [Verrucomicrobiota bacterium JB022]|nr:ATP-binding protein [Verrucomicrobiota bacterium JB022]